MTMQPMRDDEVMTWGAHKGKRVDEVPVNWLLWFRCQPWAVRFPRLLRYVGDNLKKLSVKEPTGTNREQRRKR